MTIRGACAVFIMCFRLRSYPRSGLGLVRSGAVSGFSDRFLVKGMGGMGKMA